MKKTISIWFLWLLMLASCQASPSHTISTQEIIIEPSGASSIATPNATIQATNALSKATLESTNVDINFVSELEGSLFVGSSDIGVYVELDFDTHQINNHRLPQHCQLLSNAQNAVCNTNAFSDSSETSVYNLSQEEKVFTFDQKGGWWMLTSSEKLLEYAVVEQGGIAISIFAYDFENGESEFIGKIDDVEMKLGVPRLSNSGKSMIGLDFEGLSWEFDDNWYLMYSDSLNADPISVGENIAATDSFEWSPNDALVAMIGFYRDDEVGEAGTLTCGKEVLIYDTTAQNVVQSIKVPEERCFTPIGFYPHHIWSPDSSKLVLILDQQDICVIELSKDELACNLITNHFDTSKYFASLAWSPDSNYLAFVFDSNEIEVYSMKDHKIYSVGITSDLSPSRIGRNLVWSE